MKVVKPDERDQRMIIPGMILAGGKASRMGGQGKAFCRLGGRCLIDWVVERLEPQVSLLAINSNSDLDVLAGRGWKVLGDSIAGQPGPLAGILTAMEWAAGQGAEAVITAPVDTPFLPGDLVPQLLLAAERSQKGLAMAAVSDASGQIILHPTCGVWPVALAAELRGAIGHGDRKVRYWAEVHGSSYAVFPSFQDAAFLNINTPDDLMMAEKMLG